MNENMNFDYDELSTISNCILYTLRELYEAEGKMQCIGIDTNNIKHQITKYRLLNTKVCNLMEKHIV